jgi:hypothetical protein
MPLGLPVVPDDNTIAARSAAVGRYAAMLNGAAVATMSL